MRPDKSDDVKERILQRVRERAYEAYARAGGPTLEAAATICRRCLGPDGAPSASEPPPKIKELQSRQERALREWAQASGLILEAETFGRHWEAQGRSGETEHDIYYDPSSGRWFKRNNLSYHLEWTEYFDRVVLHNYLFAEAALRFEGFVETTEGLKPIVSQPDIPAQRGANRKEVEAEMEKLGFRRIRGDDYERGDGIVVEDLHDENVLLDDTGHFAFIDPVIYLRVSAVDA
ncbi:MAG: hypothetical protein C5B50_28635 [Verrucomicrobia bacterium]|nr:MAG: hypothetical protein C5B50_28635 [Verrucomicrobiota bacterium]